MYQVYICIISFYVLIFVFVYKNNVEEKKRKFFLISYKPDKSRGLGS